MPQAERTQKDGAGSIEARASSASESLWSTCHGRDPPLRCLGPLGTHSKLWDAGAEGGTAEGESQCPASTKRGSGGLFPKWQSSGIPVDGEWWEVTISRPPERVPSISRTSTARGDSRPSRAVPASFEHARSTLTELLAGCAAAGTRGGACRHPGILVCGTG